MRGLDNFPVSASLLSQVSCLELFQHLLVVRMQVRPASVEMHHGRIKPAMAT
jgi:hypothetical protein